MDAAWGDSDSDDDHVPGKICLVAHAQSDSVSEDEVSDCPLEAEFMLHNKRSLAKFIKKICLKKEKLSNELEEKMIGFRL